MAQIPEAIKIMSEQKTLDFTLDAMMYALKIYKLSAEHHFYLKFDVTKAMNKTVYPEFKPPELAELMLLLTWFKFVPFEFMKELVTLEEDRAFLAETAIFAATKRFIAVLHLNDP